jgi:hypothetical protein
MAANPRPARARGTNEPLVAAGVGIANPGAALVIDGVTLGELADAAAAVTSGGDTLSTDSGVMIAGPPGA